MFGIGIFELLIIFVVALVALGPEKLPQAVRTLAKLVREFRGASQELKRNVIRMADVDGESQFTSVSNIKKDIESTVSRVVLGDDKDKKNG